MRLAVKTVSSILLKVARFFFIYELGDSFHLKKELYFIQAQLCGPAIHGPQGINVLSAKKNYADPCSILVRPQAQLCGPAVHDPREAGGSGLVGVGHCVHNRLHFFIKLG